MGESTLMTIEFLRARLLSERSVSRTAKQRADELGKRVMELEEQLRIMMIQREKAEAAAARVLAILENQGVGDFAEIVNSSSDQDDANGGLEESGVKEDESSTASRKSEVEDGLHESPPSQGRSLSWKGRSNSRDSQEKQRTKQIRQRQRRSSFSSTIESAGKHHLGKSCRKITPREMRSAAEAEPDNPILDAHGKRGAMHSDHYDGQPDFPIEVSRNDIEELSSHASVGCSLDAHNKELDSGLYVERRDGDEEMERVLEQQAQLIGQYQAEENAQREWEEKYNETKISTLDSYEPENRPGAPETFSESKKEATELTGKNLYYAEDKTPKSDGISNTKEPAVQILSSVFVPATQAPHAKDPVKIDCGKEVIAISPSNGFVHTDQARTGSSSQACSDSVLGQSNGILIQDTEVSSQEFAFPAQGHPNIRANVNQNQGMNGNAGTGPHGNSSLPPHGNGFIESPSSGSPSSVNSGSKFSKSPSREMQIQPQRLLPQPPSHRLGGVLQALQRAKTSLGQLSALPPSNQGTLATVAPSVWGPRYGADLEAPTGSAGLFRLPTDSFPRASFSMPQIYGSGISLASTHPDIRYAITSGEYQYPATTYVETGSRVSAGRSFFDPYATSATGMRPYSRYSLAYTPSTPERTPSRDGFSKSGMDVRNDMPARDRYSAGDRYSLYSGEGEVRRL